jgi:hypothetical protein
LIDVANGMAIIGIVSADSLNQMVAQHLRRQVRIC